MLGAVIGSRDRRGEVMILERLLSILLPRGESPPVEVPPVETTSQAEKRQIEDRLRGAEAHLAELLAMAGLDELRQRGKERRHDDG